MVILCDGRQLVHDRMSSDRDDIEWNDALRFGLGDGHKLGRSIIWGSMGLE